MRLPRGRNWFLACALLAAAVAVRADDSLKATYAAILRGDYDAGRASLARALEGDAPPEQAAQLRTWLDSYQQVVSSREELRQRTFDWNVQQATETLEAAEQAGAQGDADLARRKVYLALSFAAQAAAYAADSAAFAVSPLVQRLRPQALAAAEHFANSQRWGKAHAFYLLLERLNEDDEEIRSLRKRAARHARLEFVYRKHEDVQRRIADVSYELLKNALDRIAEAYYQEPDFRKMAEGALDNLVALCTTTRLYEGVDAASDFDGLADATAREYFVGELERQRQKVRQDAAFTADDLRALYGAVREASRQSVSLPEGLLIVEFMEGALGELDEFTSIVWPADADEFDKMMVGNFVGVGIQLGIDDLTGRLKVVTPLEDSPALEKGIQPGDLIIKVDGVSTQGWSTDKAVREITGPEGTKVTLTMFRPAAGKTIDFELIRRPIRLTTVRGVGRVNGGRNGAWDYMLDPEAGVAYIRLTNFNPDSTKELREALSAARSQGMRGLILDLRNNPGGLLNVAVDAVSTFIGKGLVVRTQGRAEEPEQHEVSGQAPLTDLPLVVLVNEHSASASEILAGALRDHDRALVLGERTFGKGSVQRVFGLRRPSWLGGAPSKARLKLTTALYYLPSGQSPHKSPNADRWGVDPDREVKLLPKEFLKMLERQTQAFVIHNEQEPEQAVGEQEREAALEALKGDLEQEDQEEDLLAEEDIRLLRSDPFEAPDSDPQLETALLHLRVKLAANLPWPRQLARNTPADATP